MLLMEFKSELCGHQKRVLLKKKKSTVAVKILMILSF